MRRALLVLTCAAACRSIPDAPTAIAYDREACAHCHMLIGDPRYAAQLVTDAGDVLDFDDPGCALRYLAEVHPAVHRLWFHDARGDRWLAASDVRFAPGADTPMGYGLAATDAVGAPGGLGLEAAAARVARRAP
jgi:copper chaperone NosL